MTIKNRYFEKFLAFLFSLRRDRKSYNDKFTIKNAAYASHGNSNYGPSFGGGNDLHVCDQSNIKAESHTSFRHSYNLSDGYSYGGNAKTFFAASYNEWTITEIEVYQIS